MLPVLAGQTLLGDLAVKVDILDQGLEALIVLLLADKAQDQQAHMGVVKVGAELVQDMHLGAAHGVLVKRVISNRHDHREDEERVGGASAVGVVGGQGERGVAKVHAGGDVGDP